ncbi:hypothetical protein ACLOJK_027503 [Asimina triloba]
MTEIQLSLVSPVQRVAGPAPATEFGSVLGRQRTKLSGESIAVVLLIIWVCSTIEIEGVALWVVLEIGFSVPVVGAGAAMAVEPPDESLPFGPGNKLRRFFQASKAVFPPRLFQLFLQ